VNYDVKITYITKSGGGGGGGDFWVQMSQLLISMGTKHGAESCVHMQALSKKNWYKIKVDETVFYKRF